MSPGMSLGNAAGAANSLGSQPSSHVAAEAVAAAQHFVNAEPCPADASPDAQQTTASNDGLVAVGSYDTQQDAVAASVHATALGEDLPASDADTDLSSVGLQPGRRQLAQSRHTLLASSVLQAYACVLTQQNTRAQIYCV